MSLPKSKSTQVEARPHLTKLGQAKVGSSSIVTRSDWGQVEPNLVGSMLSQSQVELRQIGPS